MSEFRRPRPEDTFIWPSATWAAGLRAMLAQLAYAQAWGLFPTDASHGIVGGFDALESSALTTQVKRGMALVYDSGVSAPAPKWQPVMLDGSLTGTHAAHEGQPRIDVVSLSWSMVADTSQTLGRRPSGSTPAATNTQIGCACSLTVTKGTAGASPSAPATPAGHIKLWEVYVPASSGALVYLDKRQWAPGSVRRLSPIEVILDPLSGLVSLFNITHRKASAADDQWTSFFGWDESVDLPFFARSKGEGYSGMMYPLLTPGREWRRSYPLTVGSIKKAVGTDVTVAHAVPGVGGVQATVVRDGGGASEGYYFVSLPVEARKLQLSGLRFTAKLVEAFDGADPELSATLYKVTASDGVTTGLGTADLSGLSVGTVTTLTAGDFAGFSAELIAPGDALVFVVRWDVAAGSDGQLSLYMVELLMTEAKT